MSDPAGLEAELQRFRRSNAPVTGFRLDAIRAALEDLGDPQDRIPPAVHITGTNGKGSTGAFIRAMAEAAGLKVHVFTSPHLIHVNERIRVAGELVDDETLRDTLETVGERGIQLSYFEALTAVAYLLFSRARADISIIEVGAGGATDATNVMSQPAATVVTPVSRDHETMFGVTGIAAIARLKAGIFRPGVPAILTQQTPMAAGVLREEARALDAPIFASGEEWGCRWDGDAFEYSGQRLNVRTPWLGLRGRHQAENAGAACAAIEALGDKRITADAMSAGLRETQWPARLQKLANGPLTRGFEGDMWIDAAHNPGGAAVLGEAIRDISAGARTSLIFACQAVKDVEGLLGELVPVVDEIVCCPLPDSGGQEGGPGADPGHVAQIAAMLGGKPLVADDFLEAVKLAKRGRPAQVFISGSLYLCGTALNANAEQVR